MLPLNPIMILGFVLALVTSFGSGYFTGNSSGVNAQKVADQAAIDGVNAKIAENKRIANIEIQAAQKTIIDLQAERDKVKTDLQKEHQKNVEDTNALRDKWADAWRLHFQSIGERSGQCGENGMPTSTDPASNDEPKRSSQLSEEADAIYKLAYQCDQMKDDFVLLYKWAHGLR